ncbi:MAG: membrane protein insertion efficiency factor YidD [Firmicutes bacterium]|nr:membrane protein insertion efficiency factor YidD [Bacillota bacterium]
MKKILLLVIGFYIKVVSPLLPPRCRFYPSCSRYSYEAVNKFGIKKGIILSFKRIIRCHPFHPGGYDPLPGD